MTLVLRDPLARHELHRYSTRGHGCDCHWCGSTPRLLYRYELETDGGRVGEYKGLFCNTRCFKAYHGFNLPQLRYRNAA